MQIHELNPFQGTLGSEAFLVVDNGDDTGKISVERLTQPINDRIDDIITSPAPTEQEIIDARRGWNEVVYGSLGTAIRSQVKQILAQFYKFNTYDLLGVYGTPISRTRNGVTFTWDDAGQVCEVSGEAVGGDAYASIYTQTGAWQGIFERGVTYTVGYETTDPNVKLRIAVWEGVETTPDYYYFDEDGHFGIPPEAAKIGIDLYVASGDTVSAVVKNVYMLRTYTAKEVTATIRDAMIGADLHMYNSLGDAIREQLNGKVDKVTGKVLSSNDFTDEEKTKLSGIEAGSEVNAIEAIKLDGTELTPDANRAVNIPVDETLTVEGVPADAKAVGEELENKLAIDGYSELATVGNAEQLVATQHITDTEPYNYRKTGGPNDVGDRVYDTLAGGSVVWNQIARNDVAGSTSNGITMTNNGDGSYTLNGTAEGGTARFVDIVLSTAPDHVVFVQPVTSNADVQMWKVGHSYGYATNAGAIHKFASSNSYYFIVREGATLNTVKVYPQCIDLTAALTPTIADYIYSLETANAGDGVAWFKKYFPKEYFAYCEPHFEHVQTSAKCTVGFNLCSGGYDKKYWSDAGVLTDNNSNCCTEKIRALPNTDYYFCDPGNATTVKFFDSEMNLISKSDIVAAASNRTRTSPAGTCWIVANVGRATFPEDFCFNIHGDRDGEYEAYRKRTYPIEPVILRGIPKLDASNRLYFDGDVYQHDGTYIPRYPEIDMSTMAWSYDSTNQYFYTSTTDAMVKPANGEIMNIRTVKYVTTASISSVSGIQNLPDKSIVAYVPSNSFRLIVKDSAYTTLADFKASLSGQMLIYEAKTPTTETAEPFQSPMVVDPLGTEEFIDYGVEEGTRDVSIVVGHSSEYPADLRGKLQHLPGLSSSGDGRYVVVQTGNQMTLSPDTSLGLIAALEARVAALEGGNG